MADASPGALHGAAPAASHSQQDPRLLYQLGEYHYQQGNLAEAEKAYLASGTPAAYNNLGVIAHARRDFAGCIRCWILSGNADAVSNLEQLLEEQGRAAEFPAMLLQINSPAAYHRLARMHLEAGNVARAEELLRIAATKDAWADLGVLLVRQGRLDEAEQCFRRGRDPYYNLGLLYWRDWRPARPADAELCLRKSGTAAALAALGRLYETHGEPSRAALAYWRAGTEAALLALGVMYVRHGAVRDAERLFRALFADCGSAAAGYHLLNLYAARGDQREAAALRLPRLSAREQRERHGVVASLAATYRHARPQPGVAPPRLDTLRRAAAAEQRRTRLIRVSWFDEHDVERLLAVAPEAELGEDAYLASFRIRLECNPERQDVEVVECEAGRERDALARHGGRRMDVQRRRQVQIRDWLIYGCSSTLPHSAFQSTDPLPIDSNALTWSLRQLVLHPGYQMHSLSLICSDGVVKTVEGGVIRPLPSVSRLWEEADDPLQEARPERPPATSDRPHSNANNNNVNNSNNNNTASSGGGGRKNRNRGGGGGGGGGQQSFRDGDGNTGGNNSGGGGGGRWGSYRRRGKGGGGGGGGGK